MKRKLLRELETRPIGTPGPVTNDDVQIARTGVDQ